MTRRLAAVPAWAWLLVVPAALAALAWGALAVLFPPAKLRTLVEQQLDGALRREVRFASAGLSLWPPVRLSVSGVELAEPGGFAAGVAVGVERLALDLDPLPLLSRRVVVRRLTLEQPSLHLVLRADGTTNLDSLAAPAAPGAAAPAMDLDVRAFAIRDGEVLIDDLRARRRTTFTLGTSLSLRTRAGGAQVATAGTTTVTGLAMGPLTAVRRQDLSSALSGLRFELAHDGAFDSGRQRLALERLALRFGRSELALTGVVDRPGPAARLDLRASGQRLDLAECLRWASSADAAALQGIAGSGTLAFDAVVRGALPSRPGDPPPQVIGTASLRDAAFRYAGARVGVEGLQLDARFAPDTLLLDPVRAQVGGQPVLAWLRATRFADPYVEFRVQGDVDLAAIAPLMLEKGAELSGRAAVDVRGAGAARRPEAMRLDGQARLADVRYAAPGLPKPVERVSGTLAFAADRASVRALAAHAGESSFTLDGEVERPLALLAAPDSAAPAAVRFDFRAPHLDLAEWLPTTPGAPFLPNARGGGRVRIDRLRQGRLDVRAVEADVELAPAALRSPRFSMQGYGGTVAGSARFDLRDTRRPVYAIESRVQAVQADQILSAWSPVKGLLTGTLSSDLDFSGEGQAPEDLRRTLTLVGLAALTEGQLGPGPSLAAIADFVKVPALREVRFQQLRLPLRIERGRVVTDPVVLEGTHGQWTLTGSVGFDGTLDYAVSVTLPPSAVAALQARSALAAGALEDDQGRMLLDLRVSGPAARPRVAWDTRAMRDRLAGRASQALTEQRARLESEGAKLEQQARDAAGQALRDRLGLGGDTSRARTPDLRQSADTLRRSATDALKGFFGGRRKATPAPAPADTSAPR